MFRFGNVSSIKLFKCDSALIMCIVMMMMMMMIQTEIIILMGRFKYTFSQIFKRYQLVLYIYCHLK